MPPSRSEVTLPNSIQTHDPLPSYWKTNPAGLEAIRQTQARLKTRHGLAACVPIVCQGASCPFSETCDLEEDDRPEGNRCPIEIGAILERFNQICEELNVTEDQIIDMTLVKQLVDIEIQMLRADNKMAISPEFIEKFVTAVDPKYGTIFEQTKLSPVIEYKNSLRKEHHRILNLLNSTRQDKAKNKSGEIDPSTEAARMISELQNRLKEMQDKGQIRHVIEIKESPEEEVSDGGTTQ
jgi:hypothetical protein